MNGPGLWHRVASTGIVIASCGAIAADGGLRRSLLLAMVALACAKLVLA